MLEDSIHEYFSLTHHCTILKIYHGIKTSLAMVMTGASIILGITCTLSTVKSDWWKFYTAAITGC